VGKQRVVLEHEPDVAAVRGPVVVVLVMQKLFVRGLVETEK
jgi:hypothetical protein